MVLFSSVLKRTKSTVSVGSKINIRVGGVEKKFHLINSFQADPDKNEISYKSPLGSAVLNRSLGEIVTFKIFDGTIVQVKILEIY